MLRQSLYLFCAACLLMGCVKKAYDGTKLPKAERARFEKAISYANEIALDGKSLPKSFWSRWAVSPGVHTVDGSVNVIGVGMVEVKIPFEAEAGHKYVATAIPFFAIPVVRDLTTDRCWTTQEELADALEQYKKLGGKESPPTAESATSKDGATPLLYLSCKKFFRGK